MHYPDFVHHRTILSYLQVSNYPTHLIPRITRRIAGLRFDFTATDNENFFPGEILSPTLPERVIRRLFRGELVHINKVAHARELST